MSFHINFDNQLLPHSFLWRSPCHEGGHNTLALCLGFLVTMWREDVTPLSLTVRVALTKLSKLTTEPLKGLPHLPSKMHICPRLGQISGSSTPGRPWHAPKHSPNSSQEKFFPNSLPGSSKPNLKKSSYRILRPSWISTSCSTHLHHLPTPLIRNCSQPCLPHLLIFEGATSRHTLCFLWTHRLLGRKSLHS